ncbi:hypothetical protein JCM11641_004449 [Rhodosporidiobolus odoratus]
MGIGGLLPLLKEIQKPCHVRDWAGKTVAIDAYVWLHRGAYGCAEDLALGKQTVKYVNYAMHRVRMLKYYGVTPMLVFDGGLLPSKMGTEDERERKRTDALAKGRAFLAEGKASQARECFVKAVDVTPAMAYQLIKALRREGVQYVVAPYEADPQLCYLEKQGLVDAIVTEDSDLLVFGCKNVLFKLDSEGNCVSIARDDFSKCREYNFTGWTDAEFRHMAILSGCDYLDSIVGLGLKTAYRLMRKYKTPEKVVQFVRLEGQLTVPRTYLDEFRRAELTFLHQHVFDPVTRKLAHLHPLSSGLNLSDLPFIGPLLDETFACGLADGEIDPISKEAIVDLVPDSAAPKKAYQAEPFKAAAKTKSKGKAAPTPVKGAGSILNFFSRQATSASTPAVNPVKAVANQKRVQIMSGSGKSQEKENVGTPGRSSKFFGGHGGSSVSVKGRQRELASEASADDEDAQAALLEVEMIESVVAESVAGAPEDSTGDEGVITDTTNAETVETNPPVAKPSPPTPSRSAIREASLPSFLSSPSGTPPPRKRAKRSHATDPELQLSPATEQDENLSCHAGAPSDTGISSPAESARADAGWAEQDGVSSPVAGPSLSRRLPRQSAPTTRIKLETEKAKDIKPVIRPTTTDKSPASKAADLSSDPIILSSDAAEPPAADEEEEQELTPRPTTVKKEPRSRSPRKAKRPLQSADGRSKPALQRERRSSSGSIKVREDEPSPALFLLTKGSGGSGKIADKVSAKKRRSKAQGEEEEEVDEAVKTVAASWRAKFMMPTASKTPQTKASSGRSLLPTPNTTSRPPSLGKPAPSSSSSPKKPAGRSATPASSTSHRLPLSPRSSNRIDRRPLLATSNSDKAACPLKRGVTAASPSSQEQGQADDPASPAKKRRKSSILADVSASAAATAARQPSSTGADAGASFASSSSPVVVTNPKLLAFKFRGTVSRG